ncbi:MAG: amidase [Betaproteobacteria bacterium]|nr:amidase [Betaproteobacteria bacterium]
MNELCRLSATEAVALLKRREASPLDLIDAAAARIEATDPQLNALPTLCIERAREHARRLMQNPLPDPPAHYLHGLPIAVKDNTDVEGVRCTSGSRIYADRIAPASDIVVQRLEGHGALVIGKSNLPEFAAGGNTFNDVFGVTRNPWDTRMTPSGSSGGSAAALASGQVWLATGGDFGGSIRTPSSFCSTVGLRPSPGMVPRTQKQPFSALSVEGPMARNVADCALMFDCESGAHPLDPLSHPASVASYAAAAARAQKPKRVAYSVDLGVAPVIHREVRAVCETAARKIAGDGVIVEEAHPDLSDAVRNFLVLRGAIYIARIAPLLEKHRHLLKPEVIGNTEFGLGLKLPEVVAAEIAHGELIRRMARFFENYDLLICPAVMCPPFPVETRYVEELDGVKLEGYMGWLALTCALSITACPVLAMPGGFTASGLPVGLQVAGPLRSEAQLFSYGAYLEQLFGLAGRVPIDPRPR